MGSGPVDIKLFIKDEPHKQEKLDTRRYRLISNISFEDQVIDRCLFLPLIQMELSDVLATASKAGWAPIPEGFKAAMMYFPIEDLCRAIDKKAWDWTFPGWVVTAFVISIMMQVKNPTWPYFCAVVNRLREVMGPRAVFRLPNGRRLRQKFWGLMKSGFFLTLVMNSRAQAIQHELALLRINVKSILRLWACGDDKLIYWTLTVEEFEQYMKELDKTGCLVKHAFNRREFCGFHITGTEDHPIVNPLYPDKHKYSLAHVDEKIESDMLLSLSLIYALSSDRWIDQYSKLCPIPPGVVQRTWAWGLTPLNIGFRIPEEFTFAFGAFN